VEIVNNKCLRCESDMSLVEAHGKDKQDIRCVICGWQGVIDESGQPAVLDPTPRMVPRRRRQNMPEEPETADSAGE